jgi:2-succinyl-5-enolpyruvyl-6-hydroxy-3-cyclohexene-1-carboxylate synthase
MIVIGQSQRYEIPSKAIAKLREGITILSEPLSSDDPSPSLDDTFKKIGSDTEEYKPDFLLYIGSTTISKRLRQFMRTLDDCTIVMLNERMQIEDITQHASYILQGTATTVLEDLSSILQLEKNAFGMNWDRLLSSIREDAKKQPAKITEQAVQELEKRMTKESDVYYANSTAIRLAARHANHFVFCNRGLNGIEGSLSTAVGASLVSEGNVYCVIGDLSFFYDQNALWNMHLKPNLRILLLNNGGGEIFKQLPGLENSPARDEYVMASHHTTAVGACHQYGISRKAVSKAEDIANAIDWLTEEGGNAARLLEVAITNY